MDDVSLEMKFKNIIEYLIFEIIKTLSLCKFVLKLLFGAKNLMFVQLIRYQSQDISIKSEKSDNQTRDNPILVKFLSVKLSESSKMSRTKAVSDSFKN